MIEIYFLTGLIFGLRALYKDIHPSAKEAGEGVGMGIWMTLLLSPVMLILSLFFWPVLHWGDVRLFLRWFCGK